MIGNIGDGGVYSYKPKNYTNLQLLGLCDWIIHEATCAYVDFAQVTVLTNCDSRS